MKRSACFSHRRRGTTLVEMAVVAPLTFLLLIGLIVGGLGVFRYNQISALAHEGARWAAVRGKNFERTQRSSPITESDLFSNVIAPRAAALDLDRVTCTLEWDEKRRIASVTVQYQWLPEAFFPEMTLTSTATSLVSN